MNSNWSYRPETLHFGQNRSFFGPCELKVLWMTLKKIGRLFLANSIFVHRFVTICVFKLLQSGNAKNGAQFVLTSGNLTFDLWPWLPWISLLPLVITSILQYKTHLNRQWKFLSLRCSWSIACRRYSNYIFILDLKPGFSGLGKL